MKRIITIGREFGAGGGELGRRLARELDIAYYDRDIILKTAKASAHLTPEQVRRWDERVPHEFGFTQSLFNFYNRPLSEELWDAQVRATPHWMPRLSSFLTKALVIKPMLPTSS